MRSLLIRTLMGALVFLCSSIYAYGQTFSLPSTSTTGSFTISYSTTSTAALIEELVSGTWSTVGGGQQSGSIAITKTTSGTYTYRMKSCTGTASGLVCTTISSSKSIVVTLGSSSSSAPSGSCVGAANTVVYCYDDLGRVKTVIHANGVKNSYEYDAADNRTKKESTAN